MQYNPMMMPPPAGYGMPPMMMAPGMYGGMLPVPPSAPSLGRTYTPAVAAPESYTATSPPQAVDHHEEAQGAYARGREPGVGPAAKSKQQYAEELKVWGRVQASQRLGAYLSCQ